MFYLSAVVIAALLILTIRTDYFPSIFKTDILYCVNGYIKLLNSGAVYVILAQSEKKYNILAVFVSVCVVKI